MKIRNLLTFAALGGIVYAHKKRGGVFTVDSAKESANAFLDKAQDLISKGKQKAADVRASRAEPVANGYRAVTDDNLH